MKKDTTEEGFQEEGISQEIPHADFSFQFSAAREFLKIDKKIFTILKKTSKIFYKNCKKVGTIIVLGNFDLNENHLVDGMRQIGINSIQKFISFGYSNFDSEIGKLIEENHDGAIIVNRSGQLLGSKIYLTVDNPSLDVPEECGTRHITAASFSKRRDVIAVFTLSEETLIVRKWKNGVFVDQFFPDEDNSNIGE
tara:strand:- start:296 stop:880 length:585 start_codon:yes stop_codon:yes gene_type:complete